MAPPEQSHLILGGARSGKSRHAVALARSTGRAAGFLATARPDRDMRERIERHRAERPAGWVTVEEPIDVVAACRRLRRHAEVIIVDCLTVWISNLLAEGATDAAALGAADGLAALIGERLASLVIVTNEVGQGVHPATAIGIRFRDVLGEVNQRVAAAADRVTLMVAGLAVDLKRPAPGAGAEQPHGRPSEAP